MLTEPLLKDRPDVLKVQETQQPVLCELHTAGAALLRRNLQVIVSRAQQLLKVCAMHSCCSP